jgi:hypothetical protein
MSHPRWDPGGRGQTQPIYYEPTKHTAGGGASEAQATRLWNAYQERRRVQRAWGGAMYLLRGLGG